MTGYGKIFGSMYTGSMLGAGPVVFSVWAYVIANVGRDSRLEINPDLLAAMIGCDSGDVESALVYLTSPDPKSRSEVEEGRRLLYEGGFTYFVVNYKEYREKVSKAQGAKRQQEWRERQKAEKESKGLPAAKKKVKKKAAVVPEYTPAFESFWKATWQRGHKRAAFESWGTLDNADVAQAVTTVGSWKKVYERRDGSVRPHVSTWLNNRGWDDDLGAELAKAKGDERQVGKYEEPDEAEGKGKKVKTAILAFTVDLMDLDLEHKPVKVALKRLKELSQSKDVEKPQLFEKIYDEMLSELGKEIFDPEDLGEIWEGAKKSSSNAEVAERKFNARMRQQVRERLGIKDITDYDWGER